MSTSLEHIIQAALALAEPDRVQLVETLIASFDGDTGAPLDDAWLAEIQRRSSEYDAGSVTPIPWAEVKERVRQRCRAHG